MNLFGKPEPRRDAAVSAHYREALCVKKQQAPRRRRLGLPIEHHLQQGEGDALRRVRDSHLRYPALVRCSYEHRLSTDRVRKRTVYIDFEKYQDSYSLGIATGFALAATSGAASRPPRGGAA